MSELDNNDEIIQHQQQQPSYQSYLSTIETQAKDDAIFAANKLNPLLVLPYNLKFILDSLPAESEVIATISIKKDVALLQKQKQKQKQLLIDNGDDDNEDEEFNYLEDEQLYSAVAPNEAFKPFAIDVIRIAELQTNAIVVPNLTGSHPITNNQLSKHIVQFWQPKEILLISPCTLNYNESIGKLSNFASIPKSSISSSDEAQFNDSIFEQISNLRPPHFISGITALIMSAATLNGIRAVNLILDSEGAASFERINNDSVIAATKVISEVFQLNESKRELFTENIVKRSNLNSYVTSGMYI